MVWRYNQQSGQLFHDNQSVGTGYYSGSNAGGGRNNGALEAQDSVGPIPRGRYLIGPAYDNSGSTGPITMNLTPVGHNARGRTLFRIHGNNKKDNASEGCIILPPNVRQMIANSLDRDLEVIGSAPVQFGPFRKP
jgi:hypothetical protein